MARPKTNPLTQAERRLQIICEKRRLGSIENLSKAINVSIQTIQKWGQRDSISKDGAKVIAERLNFPLGWVLTGEGHYEDAIPVLPPEQDLVGGMVEIGGQDYVAIHRFDAGLSAGPGSVLEEAPQPLGYQLFEAQWIRALTSASPCSLMVLEVDGDSMEPTLNDRDWILIDRSQRQLTRSGIYALRVDNNLWVKRLHLDLSARKVQMISDNLRYDVQLLDENGLEIVGRAIWIVGRRL